MKVFDAITGRRSIRRFTEEDVTDFEVNRLVESLIWAPSAGNLQSRKFFFIRNKDIQRKLVTAALGQKFLAEAPLVIVGCTDSAIYTKYGERGEHLYSIQDVSASVMCMMLAAYEQGLGTVWVGAFNEDEVAKVLNLPDNLRPVAMVPVGRPAKVPSAPPRVSPSEAVEYI